MLYIGSNDHPNDDQQWSKVSLQNPPMLYIGSNDHPNDDQQWSKVSLQTHPCSTSVPMTTQMMTFL
jgi:hypothetical protein